MNIKNLSVVIPLFNEAHRTEYTFKILKDFIKKNKINLEIIFVDDGSGDQSAKKIKSFFLQIKNKKKIKYQLISYKKNKGKGYALIKGINQSSFKWILTCDFDMSVMPTTVLDWFKKNYIHTKNCAYLGSRNLKKSNVKVLWFRKFYGLFFKFFIDLLFSIKLNDTQCGFKLYNSIYIKKILPKLKSYRYVHDVEIINHLVKKKIEIKELPLKWTHRKGSKINLIKDPIRMIFDLIKIKINK